jgi:hypothetical protein
MGRTEHCVYTVRSGLQTTSILRYEFSIQAVRTSQTGLLMARHWLCASRARWRSSSRASRRNPSRRSPSRRSSGASSGSRSRPRGTELEGEGMGEGQRGLFLVRRSSSLLGSATGASVGRAGSGIEGCCSRWGCYRQPWRDGGQLWCHGCGSASRSDLAQGGVRRDWRRDCTSGQMGPMGQMGHWTGRTRSCRHTPTLTAAAPAQTLPAWPHT